MVIKNIMAATQTKREGDFLKLFLPKRSKGYKNRKAQNYD